MQSMHKQAVRYECLNCGVTFQRKRYKSGAYSRQTKYCSRGCAFEARRRRLPCTMDNGRKGSSLSDHIANWFLDWDKEAKRCRLYVTVACQRCSAAFEARAGGDVAARCAACARIGNCTECGQEISRLKSMCDDCSKQKARERRIAYRRRRRAKFGNASTFKSRCRKFGAPYTFVSKKAVMERDRWSCKLCGCQLLLLYTTLSGTKTPHPLSPTIDHIIPLSYGPAGPGHVFDNCQAACWKCNTIRGATPVDSFVAQQATSLD